MGRKNGVVATSLWFVSLLGLLSGVLPNAQGGFYTIDDLGTLGGSSMATGLNDSGEVVGYCSIGSTNKAFIWDPTNHMQDLSPIVGSPSLAWRINNSGLVSGIRGGTVPTHRGFVWDRTNGAVILGTLGLAQSDGYGVNNAGQVVGECYPTIAGPGDKPFVWERATGMRDLSPQIGTSTGIYAVNDSGLMAGRHYHSTGFVWDDVNKTLTDIGTLPGSNQTAIPYGINNQGKVVGFGNNWTGSGPNRAFSWDPVNKMRDLGTLGGSSAIAFAINNSDTIVGTSTRASGADHAFIIPSGGAITDLNSLLPPGSGWELTTARDINEKGQIVGQGIHNGLTRAFLMTPPPSPNNPPAVETGADAAINEGDTFTRIGSFTDPDPKSWTAMVDYGDGSGQQPLSLNPDKTFNLSRVYPDNGTFEVTVTVTDDGGKSGSDKLTVTVRNVAPTARITAIVPPVPHFILTGDVIRFEGDFTDPGILDTHTFLWAFGDGGGATQQNALYSYQTPGEYTVTFTVTDDDGGVDAATALVLVLAPQGGLEALIDAISDLPIPSGTACSLVAKLENALRSLEAGNKNPAANQILAFINEVHALRGKKLSNEEADWLIDRAQKILGTILGLAQVNFEFQNDAATVFSVLGPLDGKAVASIVVGAGVHQASAEIIKAFLGQSLNPLQMLATIFLNSMAERLDPLTLAPVASDLEAGPFGIAATLPREADSISGIVFLDLVGARVNNTKLFRTPLTLSLSNEFYTVTYASRALLSVEELRNRLRSDRSYVIVPKEPFPVPPPNTLLGATRLRLRAETWYRLAQFDDDALIIVEE